LVARYAVSPFGATIPNTSNDPKSGSQTSVPTAAMAVAPTAFVPRRSKLISRLDSSRVGHVYPSEPINLRSFRRLDQPSNATHRGGTRGQGRP
jgi:hypothetical protein